MSTDPVERPLLVRFLDGFLQERNIKWLLAVGTLILLGSSLMLVTAHWHSYTPVWKYLLLLVCTAAVFAGSQWALYRAGLRRTGTVLLALTVLLIPIAFLALYWVHSPPLLAVTAVLATVAAQRAFGHFLWGQQPTFVVCYLLLALAGALVPGLGATASPWAALVLWAVFAVGTVKVNRHVFWLTEERRAPRIFGFFPILLLGAQFFALFAIGAAPHLAPEWLGLGFVLVAVPVLLTADAVARVFQERTGDLVRPLPWSIVVPLGVGLALCAAGLCLAALGLAPPPRPYALVLAAALTACMMAVVARRTGKQAFVWAMLAAVMLAYNFSPVFFREFVRSLAERGAQLVREERLPYAFYGLTYLPLLLALMLAWRGCGPLFARPLRLGCVGLSCLLLAASVTHAKALFPVAAVMTALFLVQTGLFRDRRLILPAIVAWVLAACGLPTFADGVLGLNLPADAHLLCLTVAAAVLSGPGLWLDGWLAAMEERGLSPLAPGGRGVGGEGDLNSSPLAPGGRGAGGEGDPLQIPLTPNPSPSRGEGRSHRGRLLSCSSLLDLPSACQTAGLLLAVGLALVWLVRHHAIPPTGGSWTTAVLLVALLFAHGLAWLQPFVSATAILFAQGAALSAGVSCGLSVEGLLSIFTLLLLGQWLLAYRLERRPESRVTQAFAVANYRVAAAWLTALLIGVYLPILLLDMLRPLLPAAVHEAAAPFLGVYWPCRVLVLVWCFDAARRQANAALATLGCFGVLGLVGSLLLTATGHTAWRWLPAVWATTALAALPLAEWLHRRLQELRRRGADEASCRAVAPPVGYVTLGVFALAAVGSLVAFPLALRVAGAVGLVGLLTFAALRRQPEVRLPAFVLVNWQAVCLAVLASGLDLQTLADLAHVDLRPACLPVALVAAASLCVWQICRERCAGRWADVALVQRALLRLLIAAAMIHTLSLTALGAANVVLAAAACACVVLAELWAACVVQREERVWAAEVLACAGAGYFGYFGVLPFGRGSMFAVLGVGVLLWLAGQWAAQRRVTAVLTRPFTFTGMWMPLAAVGIGVGRHVFGAPRPWLGANSLALLLAAGFYFWRGLEGRRNPLLLLSAVILNVALLLLWRELAWSDPQFYLVPLGISILALVQVFREEIAEAMVDPLRYLGALVILVSPTFHIVEGSYVHLLTLMVASVAVVLVSIGLRVRVLMYTGTAFLVADLAAMVVRGSIDNPSVLWLAGLALGAAVVALGAVCERHREALLQRMRVLAEALKQWD